MTTVSAFDRVLNDDLSFLKNNGRKHRVRLASRAEVEEHVAIGGTVLQPGNWRTDFRRHLVYQVICGIEPGNFRRAFVVAPVGMPTDVLSEDDAQALFEQMIALAENRPSNVPCH